MLGLIVDARTDINRWRASRLGGGVVGRSGPMGHGPRAGTVAAVAIALVALVPIGSYYSSGVPLTTQPVVVPASTRSVAPHLGPDQVVLAFPVPFALFQSAMTWQAVDGMSFAMVGGGGPDALPRGPARRPRARPISATSPSQIRSPAITPTEVAASGGRSTDGG